MRDRWIYMGATAGVLIAALALAAAPSFAGAGPQATLPRTPPEQADKTAEQVYKNIQVLKGTPADQLLPAMGTISLALRGSVVQLLL